MSDLFLKEIQESFLIEAEELIGQTESLFLALEKDPDPQPIYAQLKRLAHNFKGSGKAVGFNHLSKFSHSVENLLIALSNGALSLTPEMVQLLLACNDTLKRDISTLSANTSAELDHTDMIDRIEAALTNNAHVTTADTEKTVTPFVKPMATAGDANAPDSQAGRDIKTTKDDIIRIPMSKIDELLSSFSEQVISLSALDHYMTDMDRYEDDIFRTIFHLKKLAYDLQRSTLHLRMVTLKSLFGRLERAVRDAASSTGKRVRCEISGDDQELDKTIVDQLADPLIHMVRNAVDHGIEGRDERITKGKSEGGTVSLKAFREGGQLTIEIKDDGKGLDPQVIRRKAIEKGLISEDDKRDDKAILELIFENGFSTKEEVSELSGRGVGMNVVIETIRSLKGAVEIDSKIGHGTTFRLKMPLLLSLFNGLLVRIDDNRYIVPSAQVTEIIDPRDVEVRETEPGRKVVHLRDRVFDLLDLPSCFAGGVEAAPELEPNDASTKEPKKEMILVSEIDGSRVGYLIHQVQSIQRVVQKPLIPGAKTCAGAAGLTILGDGTPSIILDLRELKNVFLREAASDRRSPEKNAA